MAQRALVVQGPEDLVQQIRQVLSVLNQDTPNLETLENSMIQLRKKANALRLCAGNSHLTQTFVEDVAGVQKIMNGAKSLVALSRQLEMAVHKARFGPRNLSDKVGTELEMAHHLTEVQGEAKTAIQVGLDGLEKVNQIYGKKQGDEILVQVAESVRNMIHKDTKLFQEGSNLVLVGDWDSQDLAANFANEVVSQVNKNPKGRILKVTIGIAYNEKEDLLAKAEAARIHGDGVGVYDEKVAQVVASDQADHKMALDILRRKAFHPEYQRIVPLSSKRNQPAKFEALWRSQQLSPFQFFKQIKKENRIHEVTQNLIPMIIKDVSQRKGVEVSLNITAEELSEPFHNKTFAHFLADLFREFRVHPKQVIIELVEWGDEDRLADDNLASLAEVVKMGCKLALDDYGVRSSNLVRLMQLCEYSIIPDFFKIDAALVKGFGQNLKHQEQNGRTHHSKLGIRNIVTLARDLGRSFQKEIGIVAEFVSNESLRLALEQEGVTHFQGFYLAKPKPAKEVF